MYFSSKFSDILFFQKGIYIYIFLTMKKCQWSRFCIHPESNILKIAGELKY